MKKLLLTLGTFAAIAIPIATVVSCSNQSELDNIRVFTSGDNVFISFNDLKAKANINTVFDLIINADNPTDIEKIIIVNPTNLKTKENSVKYTTTTKVKVKTNPDGTLILDKIGMPICELDKNGLQIDFTDANGNVQDATYLDPITNTQKVIPPVVKLNKKSGAPVPIHWFDDAGEYSANIFKDMIKAEYLNKVDPTSLYIVPTKDANGNFTIDSLKQDFQKSLTENMMTLTPEQEWIKDAINLIK